MIYDSDTEISIAGKFSLEFNTIASTATACYIAVGMITDQMFDFARRKLINCVDLRIITGVHMATTPQVMRKLLEQTAQGKMQSGAFIDRYFHSKLYLFKQNNGWIAFVGSGNFTKGGWQENEELFVKVTDQKACNMLVGKFLEYADTSEPITDTLIDWYSQSFSANSQLDRQKCKNTDTLLDRLRSNFNIDNIDFSDHFFKKEDHLAFQPGKTNLDTPEVLEERRLARRKLYRLNDLLTERIPPTWKIYPHYDSDHIVSHIETKNHHDFNVRSLWVGYGRGKAQLKQYDKYAGSNNTPLFYMRMQVIVSYNKVGVWLMPGKNDAGQIDRENFLGKMSGDAYSQAFFDLLTSLKDPYWIEVADDHRLVTSFDNANNLREYVLNDNWRKYYFIIGRDYNLENEALSEDNIVKACLNNFVKYQPIYDLIRDKSFG